MGDFKLDEDTCSYLSEITEGYVGAEIEQIVISGLFEAFSEDRPIKIGDFEKSIKNTVPLSVTQAEQIRAIREWANVRAVAATSADDSADYIKEMGKFELKPNKPGIDEDIGSSRGGRAIDL